MNLYSLILRFVCICMYAYVCMHMYVYVCICMYVCTYLTHVHCSSRSGVWKKERLHAQMNKQQVYAAACKLPLGFLLQIPQATIPKHFMFLTLKQASLPCINNANTNMPQSGQKYNRFLATSWRLTSLLMLRTFEGAVEAKCVGGRECVPIDRRQ